MDLQEYSIFMNKFLSENSIGNNLPEQERTKLLSSWFKMKITPIHMREIAIKEEDENEKKEK